MIYIVSVNIWVIIMVVENEYSDTEIIYGPSFLGIYNVALLSVAML
jgi:hypothetical protein